MIITLVWLTGGTGIILLLARSYTGKQVLGAVGQSLLSFSFALISISLIHTTKFWVGIAFGVSAISQGRVAHPISRFSFPYETRGAPLLCAAKGGIK
jgi:hypothetical protein